MIPEAPFFFTVAAASVTLAGFSGLVAAFRRGERLRTVEVFHLRGIAETGLSNALIALLTIPVATIAGDLRKATPVMSAVVIAYVLAEIALFALRGRRMSVRSSVPQAVGAIAIDVAIIGLAVVTIVVRATSAYESVLLLLLGRPMWDFVQVLRDMAGPDVPGSTKRGK